MEFLRGAMEQCFDEWVPVLFVCVRAQGCTYKHVGGPITFPVNKTNSSPNNKLVWDVVKMLMYITSCLWPAMMYSKVCLSLCQHSFYLKRFSAFTSQVVHLQVPGH